MRIGVSGATGLVGQWTVRALVEAGHEVCALERPGPAARRIWKHLAAEQPGGARRRLGKDLGIADTPPPLPGRTGELQIVWGDIRDLSACKEFVQNLDVVIHLAAIIPPMADHMPAQARSVNVQGTASLLRALQEVNPKAFFIYSSSIAIYGDRVKNWLIRIFDRPAPNHDDCYAWQKLEAEGLIRNSGLDSCIFRLSYIVSADKLQISPLLFAMPLATRIEVCHAADAGLALARAASERASLAGQTLHLAGGPRCRTTFKAYLRRMFALFGLGTPAFPRRAWSEQGYHCGWMEDVGPEAKLGFRTIDLQAYYREVARRTAVYRWLLVPIRGLVWRIILRRSPLWQA